VSAAVQRSCAVSDPGPLQLRRRTNEEFAISMADVLADGADGSARSKRGAYRARPGPRKKGWLGGDEIADGLLET